MTPFPEYRLPDKDAVIDAVDALVGSGRISYRIISLRLRRRFGIIVSPYRIRDQIRRHRISWERLDMVGRCCVGSGLKYDPIPDTNTVLDDFVAHLHRHPVPLQRLSRACSELGYPSSDRRDIAKALRGCGPDRILRLVSAYNSLAEAGAR